MVDFGSLLSGKKPPDQKPPVPQGTAATPEGGAPAEQKEPKKGGAGLFGHAKPAPDQTGSIQQLTSMVNDMSRRVRVIEERYNNMRRKLEVTEQNMLNDNKRTSLEIKTSVSDITDMKKDLSEVKKTITTVIKEIKLLARKEDVDVLNKYLNLWEPVNFVTQNEVEKIVRNVIDELRSKDES